MEYTTVYIRKEISIKNKFIAILFATCMTFSLTACGGTDEKESSTQQSQQSNDQQEDSNWTMGQKMQLKKQKIT